MSVQSAIAPGKGLPPARERRSKLEKRHSPWTARTISETLDHAVESYADRPLVITDDRAYSYAGIQQWSRRLAAGIVGLGIEPGDHVAMVMPNHPEFVALKFAIARAGAVCVPINYLLRARELGYVLAQSDAKLLVTVDRYGDVDHLESLDELAPGWERGGGGEAIPGLRRVVVFSPTGADRSGALRLSALEAAGASEALAEVEQREDGGDPSAYSDILYTSGTTGNPKGVLLRHDQVVRMAYAAAYQRALDEGRRLCFPLPMYHVFGYVEGLMAVLFVGGAIVPRVSFDAADMMRAIEQHGVNEIAGVPAITLPLIAEARERSYDLSAVTTVFSSGGAAPESIWDDIRGAFGPVELTTAYGQTETTAATTCALPEEPLDRVPTSLGSLREAGVAGDPELGGHLARYKVVDPASEVELGPGEHGHLLVRGPAVTAGYYNKPEETAAAFTSDGWLRTGDIGSLDEEGHLRLTGRLKETFRVGGEMVMPAEVERVLGEHPLVEAAHVVGVPHERMGEVGCAWVIAREPNRRPEVKELVEHCGARLARFKVPRHIFFTTAEELPLTATGRVQKVQLAETSRRELSAGVGG